MPSSEILGVGIAIGLTCVVAFLVSDLRMARSLKWLIIGALAFRVIGATARYTILFEVYGGVGDAGIYYERGLEYAERFWRLDLSPFSDPSLWLRGGHWWGTSFVPFPSGIVLAGIGPSMLGEFIVFSLLSFVGLVGFVVAFRRSFPRVPLKNYAIWVWFFPSLWFWPSSVGKEALVMMGIGLATWGYVGKRGRVSLPLIAIGTLLIFAIRPQVAAVVLACLVLAQWLSFGSGWTPRRAVQGLLIVVMSFVGIWFAMRFAGVGDLSLEGVEAYLENEAAITTEGSTVEAVDVSLSGIPAAMVNILVRPFPWEARNMMALLSALEIGAMWIIVWHRRQNLMRALRDWRSHRLLRFAIPFIVIYSAALGMLVVNLGIIARQRVFIFPFIFILLEAVPAHRRRRPAPPASRASGHSVEDRQLYGGVAG